MSVMKIPGKRGATSSAIRERLRHPMVVDGDGHVIEFGPVYLEYLKQVAGPEIRERYLKKSATGSMAVARSSVFFVGIVHELGRATRPRSRSSGVRPHQPPVADFFR